MHWMQVLACKACSRDALVHAKGVRDLSEIRLCAHGRCEERQSLCCGRAAPVPGAARNVEKTCRWRQQSRTATQVLCYGGCHRSRQSVEHRDTRARRLQTTCEAHAKVIEPGHHGADCRAARLWSQGAVVGVVRSLTDRRPLLRPSPLSSISRTLPQAPRPGLTPPLLLALSPPQPLPPPHYGLSRVTPPPLMQAPVPMNRR